MFKNFALRLQRPLPAIKSTNQSPPCQPQSRMSGLTDEELCSDDVPIVVVSFVSAMPPPQALSANVCGAVPIVVGG